MKPSGAVLPDKIFEYSSKVDFLQSPAVKQKTTDPSSVVSFGTIVEPSAKKDDFKMPPEGAGMELFAKLKASLAAHLKTNTGRERAMSIPVELQQPVDNELHNLDNFLR